MRQIIYISTLKGIGGAAVVEDILRQSRANNARDGVSGLLYFDGKRFLQALEGEPAAVARTLARVESDPRHRAIVILSDRRVDKRDFGAWAMAWREPGGDVAGFIDRVAALVSNASPSVRATFTGFAEVRRAA